MTNIISPKTIGEHLIAVTHILRKKPKQKIVVTGYRRRYLKPGYDVGNLDVGDLSGEEFIVEDSAMGDFVMGDFAAAELREFPVTRLRGVKTELEPLGFCSLDLETENFENSELANFLGKINQQNLDVVVVSLFAETETLNRSKNPDTTRLFSVIKQIQEALRQAEAEENIEFLILRTNYEQWAGLSVKPLRRSGILETKIKNANIQIFLQADFFAADLLEKCSALELVADRYEFGAYQDLEESVLHFELLYQSQEFVKEKKNIDSYSISVQQYVLAIRAKQKRFTAKRWDQILKRILDSSTQIEKINLSAKTTAELIAAIHDEVIRDKIILFAVNDEINSILNLAKERCTEYLNDSFRRRPPTSRIRRVIKLLQYVLEKYGEDDVALWSVVAYLNWWIGERENAMQAAAGALAVDSEYSLAQLVAEALYVKLPPPFSSSHSEY